MKYNEIIRLKEMLQAEAIPFDFYELFDGYCIKYPNSEYCKCSVIEHDYSYGREKDLLEIHGLMSDEEREREDDDVLGYLTAENVFKRIQKHYEGVKMIKFEKKFLYTFADVEEAWGLIGKKGLFVNTYISEDDLLRRDLEELTNILSVDVNRFRGERENVYWQFFYYDPNLRAKRGYYLENKQIQWADEHYNWHDCVEEPYWVYDVEYRIKPETQFTQNDSSKEHHREYNIGDSDYSKYSYQVWDIWRDFNLNPWEADIVKRVLRHKKGEENDLKKVNHVLEEMMSQLKNKIKQLGCLLDNIKDEYRLNESTYNWLDCFLLDEKRKRFITLNNLYLKTGELMK